ncbi:variable large family protein (plasmid) [Borrelia turicatae 91E135]|nr:variable large family protein [Borrelia turicatae 91E135]
MEFAKGGQADHVSHSADAKAVQSAGVTAVTKLLVAAEDLIKKTVKNILKIAKEKIDEARSGKGMINLKEKE